MSGGNKGDWNREHVWARSYVIDKSGADFTDLHNIFPCDMQNNSRRGNKFFDDETDKDSWEPPENMKGDIARAMFYKAVRSNVIRINVILFWMIPVMLRLFWVINN